MKNEEDVLWEEILDYPCISYGIQETKDTPIQYNAWINYKNKGNWNTYDANRLVSLEKLVRLIINQKFKEQTI